MSRSNPTLQNPAERRFTWKGSEGKVVYYDKDREAEVNVPLPFEFLVVDELAMMTGFSDQDNSSYWSNEVRSVATQPFMVKTRSGTKQVGLYKDLTDVRSKGARYTKSIYLVYQINGNYFLGNFKAAGSALTAWIDFTKKHRVQDTGKVIITGSTEAKKGTTTYYIPTFEYAESTYEENGIASELDKGLQVYLAQYLNTPLVHDEIPERIDPAIGQATPEQVADFNRKLEESSKSRSNGSAPKEDTSTELDDEDQQPIDLSEIPF